MSDFHDDDFASSEPELCGESTRSHDGVSMAAGSEIDPRDPSARASLDLATFAPWLPRLGPVLWLDRRDARRMSPHATVSSRGILLLDHPALRSLAGCVKVSAHTQVTPHGPREWLVFHDADQAIAAKLFLLPDSDYLAWDEMTTALHLVPVAQAPARWQAHAAFVRCACARLGSNFQSHLLVFEHRRLPWLQTLGAHAPLRLSLIGVELVRTIARSESADFPSSFNAF